MGLTKFVLRRPVSTVLLIVSLFVFGTSSLLGTKLELTPELEMPMMLVSTVYAGAAPDDIDELVSKEIEGVVDTLDGVDSVAAYSMENVSIVLVTYEYGTNLDTAYLDLKKKIDGVKNKLPEDAAEPSIIEMDINDVATVTLSVNNKKQANLYNYVHDYIVPEFEKLNSVASVDLSGGQASYVRIQLNAERLEQYHLNMNSIVSAIAAADFAYPAGTTQVGNQELNVSTGVSFDDVESLRSIPITVGNGSIIYLQDVANIYEALEEETSISRYNGEETITLGIKKQQDSTDIEVSRAVFDVVEELQARDVNLEVITINDSSDMIKNALTSVGETLALAVVISMVVIYLFFGEIKASLIVGSSIPFAIFAALIMMSAMGFSMNIITLGALTLAVGMMVDNSIVVLESCFRGAAELASEETYFSREDLEPHDFRRAALEGCKFVLTAVVASTTTTCVVFIPLALMAGMSGQLFKPLGFTIVFCMIASLISAITLVPMCYVLYRPRERKTAPVSKLVISLQEGYRDLMKVIIPKRKTVMLVSVVLLAVSIVLATFLRTELMTDADNGTVIINIETRHGLTIDKMNQILKPVEDFVSNDEDIESYLLTYGSSGMSLSAGNSATITAYVSDESGKEPFEVIDKWKPFMQQQTDCDITMDEGTMMGMSMDMGTDKYSIILQSPMYADVKEASDLIVKDLMNRDDVTRVHSSLENAAPVINIDVDPIAAAAEGVVPVQVGAMVNQMLSGVEATTMEIRGEDISVMVEYPDDEYSTLDKVKAIVVPSNFGTMVALKDIAEVSFEDSPASIERADKQYRVTINADYTEKATSETGDLIDEEIEKKYVKGSVTTAMNSMDDTMMDEFTALVKAIFTAIFLIFIVMGIQFESARYSMMVMTTIPFSLIGSFGLLFLFDSSISMVSLLGFLMLVGTVVNNGILYVDTVNQLKVDRPLKEAVVDAGVIRMRPILMTTMTTVLAMLPLCLAIGDSGVILQGLALVNVGGLTASTILSLLMLPVYYILMSGKPKKRKTMKDKIMES